jgi:hypothetical protein
MVTQAAFEYYEARKKIREKGDFSILNEIAKLKGFKGGKIGEKRIEPIEQYVEYLIREMGFRGMKKGEKIDSKAAEADITPLEQYRSWLHKRIDKRKEELMREARKLEAERKLDEAKLKREEADRISMPKNLYAHVIPEEEYTEAMKVLKERWLTGHQKFLAFCLELEKDIRSWFERTKKREALLSVEEAFKTMNEYHMTHPGSMNIYTTDDLLIGLDYCFPEKGIAITIKKTRLKTEEQYKTYIVFRLL